MEIPVEFVFFEAMIQNLVDFIPRLLAALVLFVAGLFLSNYLGKLTREAVLKRAIQNGQFALLMKRIVSWTILTMVTITALNWVNFDLTGFLAGLGLTGIILGFALQDVAKNLVSGLLLLMQQPFDLGDVVKIGSHLGKVVNINLRTTELRDPDGLHVHIPNGDVYLSIIINYTRAQPRRLEIPLGVAYGTDLEYARRLALEAAAKTPGVLADPPPRVIFRDFGDSALTGQLFYWFDPSETDFLQVTTDTFESVKLAYEAGGIDIPFPIRTVYMRNNAE